LLVAFALARTIFAPTTAAQTGVASASGIAAATQGAATGAPAASNGAEPSSSLSTPIVVASVVSARALAIHANAPRDLVYYTDPNAPNRLLTLSQGAPGARVPSPAIAGTGEAGFLGDGGAATAAQFNLKLDSLLERSGIAIATDGMIFVADTRNATIRRIAGPETSEPGVIRSVAGRWAPRQNVELVEPMGIALDRAGNLFIADHGANAIVELRAATGQMEKLAQVVSPSSIAVTIDGSKVFVASAETGQVFSLAVQTREIASLPGFAAQSSTNSRGGACTAASASTSTSTAAREICPAGLAVDGGANLFVADANANRLLRLDAKTGAISVVAAKLNSPGDMAFDEKGNLYVSEQATQEILEFVGAGITQPSVTLSPTTFNFLDQPTGGTTAAQTFTLTNNSGAALTGVAVSFAGGNSTDFVNSSSTCLATLMNATSCTINVSFAPMDVGARSSTLTVNSSFATAPTAALSGTGDTYSLALATGQFQSVTVTAGDTATWMMQATNDDTFTGTVTFVCPTRLPTLTFCSFSPATVNFTMPNQTIPFTASIKTTSRTPGKADFPAPISLNGPGAPGDSLHFPALALILALVFVTGLCAWLVRRASSSAGLAMRLSQRRWVSASALLVTVAAIALLAACYKRKTSATGTPPGTANLILEATAQGAPRAIGITIVVK
jgi:sugar lactone lactonase YvrE